jgi:outer membrane lipoprotein-sorting protein
MNRRHPAIAVAVLLVAALARPASAQTADEIVAKNIAAKGGLEKLHSVQSMKQTGKLTLQGMETTLVIFGKRPNMVRQEMVVAGQTNINAFDGTTAWQLMPVMGMTAGRHRADGEFNQGAVRLRRAAHRLQDKGYKLELVGTETMGDRKVYT